MEPSIFFLVGGAAQLVTRPGAREAHQLWVGGIVRATGPDPFGNCMALPRQLPVALCEPSVTSFVLAKDNFGRGFVVSLCLNHCLLSIVSLAHIAVVHCIPDRSSSDYISLDKN